MEVWNDGTIENGTVENKEKKKQENTPSFNRSTVLVVRPVLHCPEIDGYDEVSLEQVVGTLEKENELGVGDKIVYTV